MSAGVSHFIAKTHTAEYAIHKYWSRKPHNVIRDIFRNMLSGKQSPVVVDPFCGSGVALSEAARLGATVYGADLNPVAALLSSVTCNPPDTLKLRSRLDALVSEFESTFANEYRLSTGEEIRYVVHAVAVQCKCGAELTQEDTLKKGRQYLCPACGSRLSFNLQNHITTRIIQLRTGSGMTLKMSNGGSEAEECKRQELLSASQRVGLSSDSFNAPLLPNGRILAFPGMTVGDLFTPRGFSAAAYLFHAADLIEDKEEKDATQVFLTSTVAQFSRLIPYRNDLTTGGPAWTVPGFWVAPIHLETNPVVHMRARKDRFLTGVERLRQHRAKHVRADIKCMDAIDLLAELKKSHISPDVIFFDPPYGDSVPYLEFSAIWNAMLRSKPCYEREIVISNRTEYTSDNSTYAERLDRVIQGCADVLSKDGNILITFNNLDYEAWHALLKPLRKAGLLCVKVHYQVPAVVSAKAQFSPENSYQGDFYCLFGRSISSAEPQSDPELLIREAGLRVLKSRGGIAPIALVQRAAILTLLRENIDPEILLRMDSILDRVATKQGQKYVLLSSCSLKSEAPAIDALIRYVADKCLENEGKLCWDDLFKRILDETDEYGVPSEREVREALEPDWELSPFCRKKIDTMQGQLFE